MRDILETNREGFVDIDDHKVTVSIIKSIPAFRKLLATDNGLQKLTYIALTNSHKSDLVLRGLSDDELKEAALKRVELDFIDEDDIIMNNAIAEYNNIYSKGVIGTIKQLYLNYETVRKSISIINKFMNNYRILIENNINAKDLEDEDITQLDRALSNFISNVKDIRNIITDLDNDVEKIKKLESKLSTVEKTKITPLGGGSIPKSATRKT